MANRKFSTSRADASRQALGFAAQGVEQGAGDALFAAGSGDALRAMQMQALNTGDLDRLRRIEEVLRLRRGVQEGQLPQGPQEEQRPPRFRSDENGVEFDLFPELNRALQTGFIPRQAIDDPLRRSARPAFSDLRDVLLGGQFI